MATPQALKTAITDLAVLAGNDLDALWRQVETPDEAREALQDVLPALVNTYGLAAATISADWYDDARDLVDAKGRFQAIPADLGDQGADVLARWGIGPLFKPEADWRRARVQIEGGLQLRIANASRYTVAGSAIEDPAADGWQRQGSGSCAFCAMLIGRATLYRTADSADFGAHDHCKCSAVPAWGGEPRPVKPYKVSARRKIGPDGKPLPISDADRARVREYLRNQ